MPSERLVPRQLVRGEVYFLTVQICGGRWLKRRARFLKAEDGLLLFAPLETGVIGRLMIDVDDLRRGQAVVRVAWPEESQSQSRKGKR
jgi:hypothetical protein